MRGGERRGQTSKVLFVFCFRFRCKGKVSVRDMCMCVGGGIPSFLELLKLVMSGTVCKVFFCKVLFVCCENEIMFQRIDDVLLFFGLSR